MAGPRVSACRSGIVRVSCVEPDGAEDSGCTQRHTGVRESRSGRRAAPSDAGTASSKVVETWSDSGTDPDEDRVDVVLEKIRGLLDMASTVTGVPIALKDTRQSRLARRRSTAATKDVPDLKRASVYSVAEVASECSMSPATSEVWTNDPGNRRRRSSHVAEMIDALTWQLQHEVEDGDEAEGIDRAESRADAGVSLSQELAIAKAKIREQEVVIQDLRSQIEDFQRQFSETSVRLARSVDAAVMAHAKSPEKENEASHQEATMLKESLREANKACAAVFDSLRSMQSEWSAMAQREKEQWNYVYSALGSVDGVRNNSTALPPNSSRTSAGGGNSARGSPADRSPALYASAGVEAIPRADIAMGAPAFPEGRHSDTDSPSPVCCSPDAVQQSYAMPFQQASPLITTQRPIESAARTLPWVCSAPLSHPAAAPEPCPRPVPPPFRSRQTPPRGGNFSPLQTALVSPRAQRPPSPSMSATIQPPQPQQQQQQQLPRHCPLFGQRALSTHLPAPPMARNAPQSNHR